MSDFDKDRLRRLARQLAAKNPPTKRGGRLAMRGYDHDGQPLEVDCVTGDCDWEQDALPARAPERENGASNDE